MGKTADKALTIAINPTVALGTGLGVRGTQEALEEILPIEEMPDPPPPPTIPEPAQQADAAAAEQRRRNAAGISRSDTILTGPLGAPGAAPIARKTLLGE